MYTHLLVPLDGSERAERALPVAARIARTSAARITLLQVVSLPQPIGAPFDSAALSAVSLEQCQAEAAAYLTRIAGWPLLSGLPVETAVVIGGSAPAILDTARDKGTDLIVIGSHGRTGTARWVLGSVAEHVARQSPVPVLVLREQGPMPAHAHPDPQQVLRILVPLDGSPFAEAALAPAAALASALAGAGSSAGSDAGARRGEQAALHLTLVQSPDELDREHLSDTRRLDAARAYLRRIADHLRETSPQLHVSWSVTADSDVAAALLRVAESGEDVEGAGPASRCDLIAMATHGRGAIARWALGSVTERVLHGTRLPLLIVRPAAAARQLSPSLELTQAAAPDSAPHGLAAADTPWQALF